MHYSKSNRIIFMLCCIFSHQGNALDIRMTKYSPGHVVPDPAYPGPIVEQVNIIQINSRIECGAFCKIKSDCLGYFYNKGLCKLYLEVLYHEDFTNNPDHQFIHYDQSRVSHPFECPQDVFPITDVGEIKLSIIGHGPWKWRLGRQISLRLDMQPGSCGSGSLYEYEYYYDTDFTADYSGRQVKLVSCPGFEIIDYDVPGSSGVDSSQRLVLGTDSGLFHIAIEVDKLGVAINRPETGNMAMWGYQLEFISSTDGSLLYTMPIPQYTFGRNFNSRSIGWYYSDTRKFSCDFDLL